MLPTKPRNVLCRWQPTVLARSKRLVATSKPLGPGSYASNHVRGAHHTPNTAQDEESDVYILSLWAGGKIFKRMNELREAYYPDELNKLAAHISLFRALPGSELPTIEADIAALRTNQFPIRTGEPFLMSRGVAIDIVAEPAREIYQELKNKWCRFLSSEDMSFRPHYTVQNKVTKEVAKETFKELKKDFKYSRGWVNGVTLWQYDQGSWRDGKRFTLSLDQILALDIQNILSGSPNGPHIIGFAAFEVDSSELLNRIVRSIHHP